MARPGTVDRLLDGVAGLLLPTPLLGPGASQPAGPRDLPRSAVLGARVARAPRLCRVRGRSGLRLPVPAALSRLEGRTLLHLLRQAAAARGAGADDARRPAGGLRGPDRGGGDRRSLRR